MPSALKVLGQSTPGAGVWVDMITVGGGKSHLISTLSICNANAAQALIRVAVRPAGAVLAAQHYLMYDAPLDPKFSLFATVGLTLATTDVLAVYASVTGVAFSAFGTEET